MNSVEAIVKKASAEKMYIRKKFHAGTFWKLFGLWLLGGFLSLLPTGLAFILNPVEELTWYRFFDNMEIIYACVTMAIILITNLVLKKVDLFFWINFIVVFLGTLIYGLLKSGVDVPILNVANNFSVFNLGFLLFVLIIGIFSYRNISFINTKEVISE
jgi:hypothetical protein